MINESPTCPAFSINQIVSVGAEYPLDDNPERSFSLFVAIDATYFEGDSDQQDMQWQEEADEWRKTIAATLAAEFPEGSYVAVEFIGGEDF